MAKQKNEGLAVQEKAGVPVLSDQDQALAALGIDPKDRRGKENIGADDIKPMILKIAQKMSDELEPSHKNYMSDLRANTLFVTDGDGPGEIIGATVNVIVLALRKYAVQFEDTKRGLTFERNVPWNDPRCEFEKNGEKPKATRYYDFAVIMLPSLKPAILRMKTTNINGAKALNGRLVKLTGPTFAYAFTVGTRPETRTVEGKSVTFGLFDFPNLKEPAVVTPEQFKIASKAYESASAVLEKAGDVIDAEVYGEGREPGSDDDM
jgi:hypothetical protein